MANPLSLGWVVGRGSQLGRASCVVELTTVTGDGGGPAKSGPWVVGLNWVRLKLGRSSWASVGSCGWSISNPKNGGKGGLSWVR